MPICNSFKETKTNPWLCINCGFGIVNHEIVCEIDWQLLFDTLAHGDETHKAWLAGMIQGFASRTENKQININYKE